MAESELNDRDKRLIRAISSGLPISETPYRDAAKAAGLTEAETLEIIRGWLESGIIRRLSGVIHHHRSGYGANAMVVWDVPSERVAEVGELFADRPEVTHCYQRPHTPKWPYHLYTMVHARDPESLEKTIEWMSRESGVERYRALKTVDEYKKEPVRYFEDWESTQ